SVAGAVEKVVTDLTPSMPRGTQVRIKGQVESMESSFRGLGYGLLSSVLLVYLLMVVNFQSWLDPLVILMALPGAISGIAWMLFLSHTTLSVPALMGAIMCVGVATANSILVVTALAMILGMLPMSLGSGEGGEQNAPLGRAVIGGLLLATVTTLFFVPVFFAVVHGWLESRKRAHAAPSTSSLDDVDEPPG